MYYDFFWTKNSEKRNLITAKYEPIQPILLLTLSEFFKVEKFFDIGANIGFYSVLMSMSSTISKVYSYEASRLTFQELSKNIELNNLQNFVSLYNKAVSDDMCHLEFQEEAEFSGINSVVDTSFHNSNLFKSRYVIEALPLDKMHNYNGKKLAFKIDVEGHELNVIRGSEFTLKNNECLLQIEIFDQSFEAVHNLLTKLGYSKIFKIRNDFYYTNSTTYTQETILGSVEDAVEKYSKLCLGKWPEKKEKIHVYANRHSNKIFVYCQIDKKYFSSDIEYAYYLMVDGKKYEVIWYTSMRSVTFTISEEVNNSRSIEVRGFAREVKNPDKKVSNLFKLNVL